AGTSSSVIFSKMGYQYRSVSGGGGHHPPLRAGVGVQPTNPSPGTQRPSSAAAAAPGGPGGRRRWAAPVEVSGDRAGARAVGAVRVVGGAGPLHGDPVVALVVGQGGRPRREDRHVGAALAEQPELVLLDRLADLVVGDGRVVRCRAALPERGELAGPPVAVRA